jgi:Zn-dependent peptidase ImmA (M78 family)
VNITFAETLLQGYGITQPEDIDLEAIAFDQGATVKYRRLDSCEARIVGEANAAVISINNTSNSDRQRFSLAHELGHWIQHKGSVFLGCRRGDIGLHRSKQSKAEAEANSFASQILMPDYVIYPLAAKQPLTLTTAEVLRKRFKTSLTATALKLVSIGHYPGMVVCYKGGILDWAIPGRDIPKLLRPVMALDEDSQAYALWKGSAQSELSQVLQSADTWIDCDEAEDHTLVESSALVADGVTVTLLWWKNESQIKSMTHY